MTAIEVFRQNHRTIRKALVSLERSLLMRTGPWKTAVRNLVGFLDLQLKEYWGAEERLIFQPLAATGPDAARVAEQMVRDHEDLERQLAELKALSRAEEAAQALVLEHGLTLVRTFLHHMFLEEEIGFVLAEERLGAAHLEESASRLLLLKEAAEGLEEPAAID
ncbi:MAG TPA: hemerythrin domain-containing protein [Candidatus Baltobacteraceae bacterium]|nr:hemerythrin domain-containing protein [Candidatus Baltobacteraceae bacterium]